MQPKVLVLEGYTLKALLARKKSMKVMLLSNTIWHGILSQPITNSDNLASFSL